MPLATENLGGIMGNYGKYIWQLLRAAIRHDLEKVVGADDLCLAMDSRLCDLEDTIDITEYL